MNKRPNKNCIWQHLQLVSKGQDGRIMIAHLHRSHAGHMVDMSV